MVRIFREVKRDKQRKGKCEGRRGAGRALEKGDEDVEHVNEARVIDAILLGKTHWRRYDIVSI